MSELERLIQEYCPNGVEFKPLGSVATVTAGNSAPQNAELFQGGIHPFCRTSDVGRIKKSIDFSDITDKLNANGIKGMRLFPAGSILIPKSGASTLLNNKVRLAIDAYVVSHLAVVIPNTTIINSRYLYYAVEGFDMSLLVEDKSYPSVKSSKIAESIFIPVPPMEVQEEIVRILDKFTELEAELEAELSARRKQYEFYREQLLTFRSAASSQNVAEGALSALQTDRQTDRQTALSALIERLCPNGVPYKALWELTSWDKKFNAVDRNKQPITHKYTYYLAADLKALERPAGTVKILTTNATSLYTDEEMVKSTLAEGEVVCIPWGGNPIVQYYKGKFVTGDNRIATSNDLTALSNKYLYYCLQTQLPLLASFYRGSAIQHPDMAKVLDIRVPVPPIEVQEKIVYILDRFDALCNDITIGLPAEIAMRRKQYEYYREKLLTFKKAS